MEDVAYGAVYPLKEIPWRRIAVTSSLNEVSTDPLGNRVMVRWEHHQRDRQG
jgi:hypothetical protein